MYGHKVIDDFVTRQYDLAQYFAQLITSSSHLELGHHPMSNIVCFRYVTKPTQDVNNINNLIRENLLKIGEYYIVQTVLRGDVYLRVTIMSPYTDKSDLEGLVAIIESTGKMIEMN